MKLSAAKKAADAVAKAYLGDPKVPCPKPKTGLLVVVYRKEDGEVIEGAHVALSGEAVELLPADGKRKKGRVKRYKVEKQIKATDPEGLARYLPFDPGKYQLVIRDLPDHDIVYVWPGPVEQAVVANSCPIVEIEVERLARPEVRLAWKHDVRGVPDIPVTLDGDPFSDEPSPSGVTEWEDVAVDPGPHQVSFTLPIAEDVEYKVYPKGSSEAPETLSVDVPPGRKRFEFLLLRLTWMKFHVRDAVTKSARKAKLTLKWPEGGAEVDSGEEAQKILRIPQVEGPSTKCAVVSLETPDDDEVYEFVGFG